MFTKIRKKIDSASNGISSVYIDFIFNHPYLVLISVNGIAIVLTTLALLYNLDGFTTDPRMGFETRNTQLSNGRLAVYNLQDQAASAFEIIKLKHFNTSRFKRSLAGNTRMDNENSRTDIQNTTPDNYWDLVTESPPSTSTIDTFTVNYDEYGTFEAPSIEDIKNPCFQYVALGSQIPYTSIDIFSKVIFEVKSFNDLFTFQTFKELCQIDEIVHAVMASQEKLDISDTHSNIPKYSLPYSFNLPLYSMCLNLNATGNHEKICSHLNEGDIFKFKKEIIHCHKNSSARICQTNVGMQLSNYIIQKDSENIMEHPNNIPLKISVILPLLYNSPTSNLYFTQALMSKMEQIYNGEKGIKLEGANFMSKEIYFQTYLLTDIYFGVLATIFVVLLIWIYSNSVIFTIVVSLALFLSLGVAFFVYSIILAINFFPFINFLVIILVIAIGSDDTFFLNFAFNSSFEKLKKLAPIDNFRPIPNEAPPSDSLFFNRRCQRLTILQHPPLEEDKKLILKEALSVAFSHAAIAMLVTSATTAIAFFANVWSSIVVVKCFGVFAGLTVVTNYFFVVTTLPATLVIINNKQIYSDQKKSFINFIRSRLQLVSCSKNIYQLLIKCRLLILLTFILSFAFSIWSIIVYPGITLPRHNPLQILRSSHPFEWFDEYSKDFFQYDNSSTLNLNFNFVWGLASTNDSSNFNVNQKGTVHSDPQFNLNSYHKLIKFKQIITHLNSSSIKHPKSLHGSSWLNTFLTQIESETCNLKEPSCCKYSNQTSDYLNFNVCAVQFSRMRLGPSFPPPIFSTIFDDGPVFRKKDLKMMAYFVAGPSHYKISILYKTLTQFFNELNGIILPHSDQFKKPIILSSPEVTKCFDLMDHVSSDILSSVALSLTVSVIVIGLMTRKMVLTIITLMCISNVITCTMASVLWLGWKINVLETTIIVLTIGLSFDYTLHAAIAYKSLKDSIVTSAIEKATQLSHHVSEPILTASITNIIVGFTILWTRTQAFYEIGIFMIIMTTFSLLMSLIYFPILMVCYGEGIKRTCSSFCSTGKHKNRLC